MKYLGASFTVFSKVMAWYPVRHGTPSARLPGQQDVQVVWWRDGDRIWVPVVRKLSLDVRNDQTNRKMYTFLSLFRAV